MIENIIDLAQKEVLENNPSKYYVEAYKTAEVGYWKDLLIHLYKKVTFKKEPKCLDIGAAYGTLSMFCKVSNPNCNLTVIDNKKYISDELIKKHNIKFINKNIELDEFETDEKFDVIILTEVLEHFNFLVISTLKKISDLLDYNGSLFISTPNAEVWGKCQYYDDYRNMPLPNKDLPIEDTHIYQYNFSELCEIFKQSNLRILNGHIKLSGETSPHFNLELKRCN